MLDLDFIKNVKLQNNYDELTPEDKKKVELEQLSDIARYISSTTWQYKGDTVLHDGVIAQELLQVPGLRDAVHKDENGVLSIDSNFVSLATLGYIAALTRLVIDQMPITSTPKDIEEQEKIIEEIE